MEAREGEDPRCGTYPYLQVRKSIMGFMFFLSLLFKEDTRMTGLQPEPRSRQRTSGKARKKKGFWSRFRGEGKGLPVATSAIRAFGGRRMLGCRS